MVARSKFSAKRLQKHFDKKAKLTQLPANGPEYIDIEKLPNASYNYNNKPVSFGTYDGDKFDGSFGVTNVFGKDYWLLRQRSIQLFSENLYAFGILNRLATAIINTGLHLEVSPEQDLIGLSDDESDEWAEMVEQRFGLWAEDPALCDYEQKYDFGQIQRIAYLSALMGGDVLCVMRYDSATNYPSIQLIDARVVQNPPDSNPRDGHTIEWGVELDKKRRHVAYWVTQEDGSSKRLPVKTRSGRRLAWMVYGVDTQINDVRGTPLLSIILQSLKEIDRYRDSAQRKATINSMLAMYIQKDADKQGTLPIQGSATRVGDIQPELGEPPVDRSVQWAEGHPGLIFQELQKGEKPIAHQNNGEIHYKEFEDAIVQSCAWALNIPPEILKLSFNSNYSASAAANAEFRMYTDQARTTFGSQLCKNTYQEWLMTELQMRKIDDPGILEASRDPARRDEFNMWMRSDWSGSVKPSADIVKTAKGYAELVKEGFMDRAVATREISGRKFSRNARKLERQNQMVVKFQEPLMTQQAEVDQAAKQQQEGGQASGED